MNPCTKCEKFEFFDGDDKPVTITLVPPLDQRRNPNYCATWLTNGVGCPIYSIWRLKQNINKIYFTPNIFVIRIIKIILFFLIMGLGFFLVGDQILLAIADMNDPETYDVVGIVTEGVVHDVDTSAWPVGTELYLYTNRLLLKFGLK